MHRSVLGIPQYKEKNKEKETFQKQSAMLEEVVKLPLALVWHVPYIPDNFLSRQSLSVETGFAIDVG